MKKPVKFSVNQLIIDDAEFHFNDFESIVDEVEPTKGSFQTNKDEILSIKKIARFDLDNRFIGAYFHEGSKFPYSDVVLTDDLEEVQNPRQKDQIEPTEQLFILIDVYKQRIYFSDARKRPSIKVWLTEKTEKEIIMKSIFSQEDFIDKLKSVKEIDFTLVPDLFNSNSNNENTLSKELALNILGFGAVKAKLRLEFDNVRLSDRLASKIKEALHKKEDYKEITIIGRTDGHLESVFNLDETVSSLTIEAYEDIQSRLLSPNEVFDTLVKVLKENEV